MVRSGALVPAVPLDLSQVRQGPVELARKVPDPQQAPNPAEELDLVDRLGQKVIGPGLDPPLEVGRFVEPR